MLNRKKYCTSHIVCGVVVCRFPSIVGDMGSLLECCNRTQFIGGLDSISWLDVELL
jgi:hypothetical protein